MIGLCGVTSAEYIETTTEQTHLDQSNYLPNKQQVLTFDVHFTSLCMVCKNAGSKSFKLTQIGMF
jgi:hypothetical protein